MAGHPVGKAAVAALGVELKVMEKIGQRNGHGSLNEVFAAEYAASEARAAALIAPVVSAVLTRLILEKLDGVRLDSDKPFSDASLSGALSDILGVPVASIKNREALKDAFKRAVTRQVSIALQFEFRDVFDRQALKEDGLRAVGTQINIAVPGMYLRDLSDRQTTIDDVAEYGRLRLSDLTGVNFTNLSSKQAVKEDIFAWAMPQVREMITGEQAGDKGGYKKPLKMDTKSIRNREAQRRYRERHAGERVYNGVRE